MGISSKILSRRFIGIVLAFLFLMGGLLPSASAQNIGLNEPAAIVGDEEPPPTVTVEEGDGNGIDAIRLTSVDETVVPTPPSTPVEDSTSPSEDGAEPTPLPEEVIIPTDEVVAPPEEQLPTDPSLSDIMPIFTALQGEVTVDVVVSPERLKAGGEIKYTYKFKNNAAQARNNIIIEAIWTHFSDKSWQFCGTDQCAPFAVTSGLVVTALPQCPVNIPDDVQDTSRKCYQIGSLGTGVAGEFSVKTITKPEIFPQTKKEPTRPAGSARLYLEAAAKHISEDTASALIEGPVFVLTKVPASTANIYPLESTEFIITLGNATDPSDQINGQRREDAIPAQNTVLVDTWPAGSELVAGSVTGGGVVDATARTITWRPGRLDPGQSREFRARFKKLDVNQDCERLTNSTYSVTSDEMPIRTGTTRFAVNGAAIAVRVVTPLVIKSVSANPGGAIYGEESTLTIIVQNYFNQPVNGAQLKYTIQSNAYYIPGSASTTAPNTLVSAPTGAELAGTVVWNLNMPAGSMTTPTETSFTLRVRGGFLSGDNGVAFIVAPTNIPSACIRAKNGRVNFTARLFVAKLSYKGTSFEYVERYSEFTYVVTLQNKAATVADNVTITDSLPRNDRYPANFSYIVGSATIDGIVHEPDSVVNGNGGSLVWNNIDVPAGATVTLRYTLKVDGYEFVEYPNTIQAILGSESIAYTNRNVRVKINPPIHVTKTVNKTETNIPGDTVKFTLHLENRSPQTYNIGLFDKLGSFTYVSQESGYAQPSLIAGNYLSWPLRTLPPNGTLDAVIVAKLPTLCETRTYANEILFLFDTNGDVGPVQPIPAVKASVKLTCGTNKIEYSQTADRATISLKDQVVYSLNIKNNNTVEPITNITVVDVLPQGFSYVGIAAGSNLTSIPQQQTRTDGRIQLTWQIPSLAASKSSKIAFTALAGDIAGPFDNWLRATAPNLLEAKCTGRCTSVDDNGEVFNYAYAQVLVQPLITMEPTINDQACASPGDKRIYRLSIINTNIHAYQATKVSVNLPLGLTYLRSLNGTTTPTITRATNGDAIIVWQNLTIPAKPKDKSSALLVLEIELEVGQTWRNMPTKVEVTSPNGLIPLKDGVFNPIVRMCPTSPSVSKVVDRSTVFLNDTYVYEIAVVNPDTKAELTISLSDDLASNISFVESILGQKPTVQGKTLTWQNLKVPPAVDEDNLGEVLLRFKVRVISGSIGDTIVNTANITSSVPTGVNTDRTTAKVKLVKRILVYLPGIAR